MAQVKITVRPNGPEHFCSFAFPAAFSSKLKEIIPVTFAFNFGVFKRLQEPEAQCLTSGKAT